MTVMLSETCPVTDVTHDFIGPLRVRTRAHNADNDEVRHMRHALSQEVHDA